VRDDHRGWKDRLLLDEALAEWAEEFSDILCE
jgi:hypothetical protein